jgi:hypothetical protein
MTPWPKHPVIYEINAWVWLQELSLKHGTTVDLGSVPSSEWDAIAVSGFDAVWFMGVWERSPAGIAIANRNHNLLADFRRALPDYCPEDNVGSPYCVRRYVVDNHLGGTKGLAVARKELSRRGLRLILDFVPNHVAPDHPWVGKHPEYFVQGSTGDLTKDSASFLQVDHVVFACGKDPYFPAWPDVLQLNAFNRGLRAAAVETVLDIASQCDGVRCDMAMLLLNKVFERTWGKLVGAPPPTEYWPDTIRAVRALHPEFLFIAEAYWDLEWELQQLGFDFCYDKRLYDRLEHDSGEHIRLHLCADAPYQQKLLRFIENHDEPRASVAFPSTRELAAAVTTSTLMGARLFHEGQFEGRKVKLPVFLGRRPVERVDNETRQFYAKLLTTIKSPLFREGQWRLLERTGWPDNQTHLNIVAWCWEQDDNRSVIVVNLSDAPAQAVVHLNWSELAGRTWNFTDVLSGRTYVRLGEELRSSGLYVELSSWKYHVFICHDTSKEKSKVAAASK